MHDIKKQGDVAIIGCGISGLSCAILLSEQGFNVTVYDKISPLNLSGSQCVSFNYTINGRGRHILKSLGVLDQVLASSRCLKQRVIHAGNKEKKYNYGRKADQVLHAIPRTEMILIIYRYALQRQAIQFKFGCPVKSVNIDGNCCVISADQERSESSGSRYDFVIGCDGVNSKVRDIINMHTNSRTSMEYFAWSYNEVHLTPEEVKRNNLDVTSLHVWPMGKDSMIVGIPNADNSTSCLYCAPASTNSNPLYVSKIERDRFYDTLRQKISSIFGPIKALSKFDDATRLGRMVRLRTDSWFYKGKLVLVGDSAHSIFPFYGQGMNAALQDSFALVSSLEKFGVCERAFLAYQRERKVQTDILDRLSLAHFYFLRDKSHKALSRAKYVVDEFFCQLGHDKIWHHEYGMLAHSDISFDRLLTIIRRQRFLRYVPPYLFLWLGAWAYYLLVDYILPRVENKNKV